MYKVLVVDDDADMLKLVQATLKNNGYKVKALNAGKGIIEAISTFLPDLVLLDIELGDTDGREICQEIKSTAGYYYLPIILYSAHQFPDLTISDCKANAFIQKPFNRIDLINTVGELIAA